MLILTLFRKQMSSLINNEKITFLKEEIDSKLFNTGVFFLASAPFLSCLFFLYPLFKGLRIAGSNIINNKFNQIFLLISLILITKSIFASLQVDNEIESWQSYFNWAGIANLVPLFVCFIGFDSYLNDEKKRIIISKYFIAGTIPFLISCVGQFWFNWYGPFEVLNGLITWFQRPLITNQNLTGLFNNPNTAGNWLTMMWPISVVLFKEKLRLKEYLKSKILLLIIFLITTSIVLTNSRSAWIGLLITAPFLLGKKSLKWYLPVIGILIVIITSSFLPFVPQEIREFLDQIIPLHVQSKVSEITINFTSLPRLKIWSNAFEIILQKPLFGWGANSFPYLYEINTGVFRNHSHNLFLELSISYGLIVSILFFKVILEILFKSFFSIFKTRISVVDKGWWLAGFFFFFSHLVDILLFDIRINLTIWIFLIGLKNTFHINAEIKNKFELENKL